MVNEAFIAEIQSGDREHLEALWNSVWPFVARQARRRVKVCQTRGEYCGVDMEDLMQDGFLAFLRAAETYQGGGRMTFLGWLDLYLKNAFNEAVGVRRVQDYREPMRWAVSLSQPIGDGNGGTLGDLLAEDHSAVDCLENVIWMQQLRRAMNKALAELPADCQHILARRYWQGQTVQQIAAECGKSHQAISAKANRALQRLRKQDTSGKLAEFALQL